MAQAIAEVYFNEAEGLDPSDFNEAQRVLRAQLWDFVVGGLERTSAETATAGNVVQDSPFCWGNGGYMQPGAGARSLEVLPGILIQHDGGPDGTDPVYIPYFISSVQTLTHDDEVSGNDRWDVVQVKVEYYSLAAPSADNDQELRDTEDASVEPHVVTTQNVAKRRNSKITLSIKKGTPAASPTEPAVDPGYKKLCAVKIPNGIGAGTITGSNIRDYRIPLRVCNHLLMGTQFGIDPADWTVGDGAGNYTARITSVAGATRQAVAFLPGGTPHQGGRLLRIGLASSTTAGAGTAAKAELVRIEADNTTTVLKDVTSDLLSAGGGNARRSTSLLTEPWWRNSYQSGVVTNTETRLALRITAGDIQTVSILYADFDMAGL